MKNLYAQFQMKPPSKDGLAQRLMGEKSRTTGVALPVRTSKAPVSFYDRVDIPASKPFIPSTYSLGAQGGLSGLGMLGDGTELLPGISFGEGWTYNDFMGDANWVAAIARKCGLDERYSGGLNYQPPPPGLLSNAAMNWQKLIAIDGIDPAATNFKASVSAEMLGLIKQADSLVRTGHDALCGKRTNAVESQRIALFNQLKGKLAAIANYKVPDVASVTGGSGGTSTGGGGSSFPKLPGVSIGSGAGGLLKPTSGGSMLPTLALGGAALIVGVLVLKKVLTK